jgi:hypothetical protein
VNFTHYKAQSKISFFLGVVFYCSISSFFSFIFHYYYFIWGGWGGLFGLLLPNDFGCSFFFWMVFFCVPYWFEIFLIPIVLAFTLKGTFRGMSKVLTFLLASFLKLVRLFYLCRYPPFLCFSLVLFFLLLGVGFELNLAPFWGYLSFILHAIVCFIGTFEPSRMRSNMFFTYPLIELFETQWTS